MRVSIRTFSLSLFLLLLAFTGNATAIVVSGTQPSLDFIGIYGFAYGNVVQIGGASGVYIGNRWVLTAGHVGANDVNVQGTTYYYDGTNSYRIKNPTGYEGVDSTYTDLRLFRLTEDPDLPELGLATQSLPYRSSIFYVGYGGQATGSMLYWNKVGDEWELSDTPTYFWGYMTEYYSGVMSWGTNAITSDNTGSTLEITSVGDYDLIALQTSFTWQNGDSQAVSGDSGSAMFYNDPEDGWVLAGIVSCIATYENAPTQAIVDSLTYSVDLSFYLDEINSIMNPIPGDANRDGMVDGSDATILAQNWRQYTNLGSTVGDFNEDGIVDGSDATILATNWQATSADGSGDNGAAVPEPSTWAMILGMFLLGACRLLRR